MTYDKLMVDIGERLRDWHFAHPHAPTALYLGQAQSALVPCENGAMFKGMTIHFTEDADYCALG